METQEKQTTQSSLQKETKGENQPAIIQKLLVKFPQEKEDELIRKAYIYYAIISEVNRLSFTNRELELMAFTSLRGNISYAPIKEEFCRLFNSSIPTVGNMISKLTKVGVFVKDDKKRIVLNPIIRLDFSKDIIMNITLKGETNG